MVRGDALSEVLAKPHAVAALLFLLENPGVSANKLARGMGAYDATPGIRMADHLKEAGLAAITEAPSPFPGRTSFSISLTPLGVRLARVLGIAVEIYPESPSTPADAHAREPDGGEDDLEARRRDMRKVIDDLVDALDRAKDKQREP